MEVKDKIKVEETFRECGMLTTVGVQGSGKSHQNKIIIASYVKDKIYNKVRGRKALLLDTNGEFAEIDDSPVRRLAVKDVSAWCRSNLIEVRRIDMKSLSPDDKLKILVYVLQHALNCMLVLEDINTIVLEVSQMKDIVSFIVNLRHKGVDILISYQSLRAVPPRILDNSRWMRLHYFSGNVKDVKGKLNEQEMFKIAQLIINTRFYGGDKWFFLYVHTSPPKIEGDFTKEEFISAAKKFLMVKKDMVKEEMDITGHSMEVALNNQSELLFQQFYGNEQ